MSRYPDRRSLDKAGEGQDAIPLKVWKAMTQSFTKSYMGSRAPA